MYKKAFFYPLSLNFTSQRYKKTLKSLQGKGKNVTLHETGYDWQGESTLLSKTHVYYLVPYYIINNQK